MSIAESIRFLWQRLAGRVSSCPHVEEIRVTAAPSARECPACVARGDRWRALRLCTSCGEIGCCDSSKNRHARRHAEACGHPVVTSTKAGDDWYWCFIDARLVDPGERRRGADVRSLPL